MSAIENKIARTLIDTILARGYAISVWEGEDYAIERSVEKRSIMDNLASTDEDVVEVWTVEGHRLGSMLLIWGNGEDLISDSVDCGIGHVDAIIKDVNARIDA